MINAMRVFEEQQDGPLVLHRWRYKKSGRGAKARRTLGNEHDRYGAVNKATPFRICASNPLKTRSAFFHALCLDVRCSRLSIDHLRADLTWSVDQ